MNRETYDTVSSYISQKIVDCNFKISKVFDDKDSFGDIDIIIDSEDLEKCIVSLEPIERVKNGNTTSLGIAFESAIIQVDLVCVHSSKIDTVHAYMSFGFFGMSVGIPLARQNLIYGSQGLETKEERVNLSTDPAKILAFLGIDLSGVKTPSDLIVALGASKIDLSILAKSAHKYERLKNMQGLFERAAEGQMINAPQRSDDMKAQAIDYFGKRAQVDEAIRKTNQKKEIAAKFNGKIVMEATGLTEGEELGKYMTKLRREVFTDASLFVLTPEEIRAKICGDFTPTPPDRGLAPPDPPSSIDLCQ